MEPSILKGFGAYVKVAIFPTIFGL
jgi:hypothetical protein